MEELIAELNLPFEGEMLNNTYVINSDNSKDFALMYSILSSKLEEEHDSKTTETETKHTFYNDWYTVTISADFDKDIYSLVIEER